MQAKIRLIDAGGGLEAGEEVLFEDDAIAVTSRRVFSQAAAGAAVEVEDALFADDRIAVTARRLVGNFGAAKEGRAFDEAELGVVGAPNRFNGGYQSRRPLAVRLLAGGLALAAVGAYFTDALRAVHYLIDPLVFLVGALSATVGLYLLLNSLFRNRPNTTVIFPILDGGEIIASYPDWDNPQADELTRHFARAKRSLGR